MWTDNLTVVGTGGVALSTTQKYAGIQSLKFNSGTPATGTGVVVKAAHAMWYVKFYAYGLHASNFYSDLQVRTYTEATGTTTLRTLYNPIGIPHDSVWHKIEIYLWTDLNNQQFWKRLLIDDDQVGVDGLVAQTQDAATYLGIKVTHALQGTWIDNLYIGWLDSW